MPYLSITRETLRILISPISRFQHTTSAVNDEAWEPVASLISRLHRLEELDFVLEENSFPSTLLNIVSLYHPDCQVNIWPCQGVEYSAPGIAHPKYPFKGALEFGYDTFNLQGLKAFGIGITMNDTSDAVVANKAWLGEMLPFILMPPNPKQLLVQSPPHGALKRRSAMSTAKQKWADLAAAVNPVPACSLESISLFGRLYPEFTNSEIAQLNQCNIYRALGQFGNLHTLILDLQFNSESQLRRPINSSEAQTSFINAATGENLALDIWSVIASTQTSTRRLQSLRIVPFGWETGNFRHI
ncbi:hypothetical protein BJY00DRAFT_307081 [Aspergillus carlsbadensis]|nr:hypothetical protein BJY00DRAFT_307081 [Aspergillus carlsbadensis]